VLYISNLQGEGPLSAYDTHTGELLWQPTGHSGTPTVANGMLYVSSSSGFSAYGLP
jgi:outer membrane protein assembly factor BamB